MFKFLFKQKSIAGRFHYRVTEVNAQTGVLNVYRNESVAYLYVSHLTYLNLIYVKDHFMLAASE